VLAPRGRSFGPDQSPGRVASEPFEESIVDQSQVGNSFGIEGDRYLANRRGVEVVAVHQPGPQADRLGEVVGGGHRQGRQLLFDAHFSSSMIVRRRCRPRWMSALTVPTGRPVDSLISAIPRPTTWRRTTATR